MDRKGHDFLADWQGLARQSWDAWKTFAERAGMPMEPAVAAGSPTATWERVLDGMKGYNQWLQAAQAFGGTPGSDWQAQLRRMFDLAGSPLAEAVGNLDSAGAHGFESLMKSWLAASPVPAMRDWLQTPGFGLGREQQHEQQQLMSAVLEYGDRLAAYNALLAKANAEAVDGLEAHLSDMADGGQRVESIKELYNLWVDAAEAAYARVAMSPEFREAYGAMVNAQMRVRAAQQKQVEALAREMGMPTRSEVDSLGQRLQAVRRQAAGGGAGGEWQALREEVTQLRARVAELEAGGNGASRTAGGAAAKAAPAKAAKAPAAKKAVKKAAKAPAKRRPAASRPTSKTGSRAAPAKKTTRRR